MAKADLIKFRDLLVSDSGFQEKFRKAAEAYKGPQDEKSVFENLLLPLGKEHGLSATYEEFKEYTGALKAGAAGELSEDELTQVAGGKNSGIGFCAGVGIGDLFGGHKDLSEGYRLGCQVIGASVCLGAG